LQKYEKQNQQGSAAFNERILKHIITDKEPSRRPNKYVDWTRMGTPALQAG
jgi:hypothetical protein